MADNPILRSKPDGLLRLLALGGAR